MNLSIRPILIIILLSAVSVGIFYVKVNLTSENPREHLFNAIETIKGGFLALADDMLPDESYFFPTYPQRLMYLAAEISLAGEELTALNEGLVSETKKCDCKFALSQCIKQGLGIFTTCQPGELKVFGDPCPNREQIEKKRSEIMDKNGQLTHLRNLLKKEMETGLERELMTLRPEVAEELKSNLEKILKESDEIIQPAKTSLDLLDIGLLTVQTRGQCSATCELGPVCGAKACVAAGTGEQKQINLKFKVGVAVDDLELGKIGIKNINLVPPEEIQLPKIEDSAITIPAQGIVITFPQKTLAELQASKILDLSSQSIGLSPQISLPQPQPINLSCPKLSFLKIPELSSLPELPEKIEIPSLKIPEIKFCPKLPALPGIPGIPGIEKIEEMVEKLEEEIKEIEKKIKTVTDITKKNELNEWVKKLKEEAKKIKEGAKIPEIETPEVKLPTPELPKKTELKTPDIKESEIELPQLGLSSSYQCSSASADGKANGSIKSIEPSWYFQTFSFLSEKCQELPDMTDLWLTATSSGCFDPKKLPNTIVQKCNALWSKYYSTDPPIGNPPPPICNETIGMAAVVRCQNLFNQEREPIPSSCTYEVDYEGNYIFPPDFDPVGTLKNKCQELKDKRREEPPEPCKILPLFTGEIGAPYFEEYSTSKASCPAQKIGDFPAGFGGIQLNCPLSLPTLPKITFPKIIIPDIIMPEFSIPPFVKIKLPSFIFEDLVLPDYNLCNLDDCQNIFPDLNFGPPFLKLPQIDPFLKIPDLDFSFKGIPLKIPLPDIKLSIRLPSIPFSLPQLNLGNLILPELEIPKISLPKPKITFGFSGIDLSAIFDLIQTFILNALGVPDFSLCISFNIPSALLSIVYPDYYISWMDFPTIPEIPFCKDVSTFCKKIKTALGEEDKYESCLAACDPNDESCIVDCARFIGAKKENEIQKKTEGIQNAFNKFVSEEIQTKLDELAETINNELTEQTNLIMEEYAQIIREAVKERMAEVEANIKDYIKWGGYEDCLAACPFEDLDCISDCQKFLEAGKFAVEKLKIPPIVKTLPERKINLPLSKIGLPEKITIPWSDDLKKIKLSKDLTYDLPPIPLSKLNFQKEIPIKGPGFQSRTLTVNLGNLGGSGDCLGDEPKGGNPLPISQFQDNLGNIINIKGEIKSTSKKISDILE